VERHEGGLRIERAVWQQADLELPLHALNRGQGGAGGGA
jgi:hypothetical protein